MSQTLLEVTLLLFLLQTTRRYSSFPTEGNLELPPFTTFPPGVYFRLRLWKESKFLYLSLHWAWAILPILSGLECSDDDLQKRLSSLVHGRFSMIRSSFLTPRWLWNASIQWEIGLNSVPVTTIEQMVSFLPNQTDCWCGFAAIEARGDWTSPFLNILLSALPMTVFVV